MCSTRSPGPSGTSGMPYASLTIARCGTPTSLGVPVDPEVNSVYASDSA
jgi:hypothetical protein